VTPLDCGDFGWAHAQPSEPTTESMVSYSESMVLDLDRSSTNGFDRNIGCAGRITGTRSASPKCVGLPFRALP
jgi:hypothetical protein